MEPSNLCYTLIKTEEGLIPAKPDGLFHAYHGKADKPEVWTIYYGITWYPNGKAVREGDTCTAVQGDEYLKWHVERTSDRIDAARKKGVVFTQNQFDSLTSMGFNVGVEGLITSTLWARAMVNPFDVKIWNYNPTTPIGSCEFLKWVYSNKKVVGDLVERRCREADMYGNRPYHFKS